MTSLEFRDFRSNDMTRPFSLEEVWKRSAAWAGIHDIDFNHLFYSTSLTVTGTGNDWITSIMIDDAPPSFTVTYHKEVYRQGLRLYLGDGTVIDLIVGTDENGYPTIWTPANTVLQKVPVATPQIADVEVEVRQQTLNDTSTDIWFSVSLYLNDAWVTTYSRVIPATATDVSVGLSAYDLDEVAYTEFRIPELCETAEFGTLDPGEEAFSGLQRTIEGRYLKSFSRYDGSLRVWRKRDRDSTLTFGASVLALHPTSDLTQLSTHVRMMGAYIWGEAVDATLLGKYGHRFREVHNPMLLTEEECDVEAANTLKRSEEASFGLSFQAQHVPILEPEDRIEVDGQSWIINDVSFEVSEGQIVQVYNCRRYVWAVA